LRRLCTICARGGSKGVKGKNLRSLLGQPLIAYSLQQARASGLFELIAVSSDAPEILAAAQHYGADLMIERPKELASDAAAKVPAIHHALMAAEERARQRCETLVDLDATSPLRLPEDIRAAVALLESASCRSVITGAAARHSPYFNMVEQRPDGSVTLCKPADPPVVRRQDAPSCFDMNASIYVWKRDAFAADPRVFYEDTRLYEMPAERSVDLDSELDFAVIELLMRRSRAHAAQGMYRQKFDLSGKRALVTGALGILGQAFTAGLADCGASVIALDLDANACDARARALRARYGVESHGVACDIRDAAAVEACIAEVESRFGPVEILINNAATKAKNLDAFLAPLEDYDVETWREVMAVNLDGAFLVARAVGRRMAERGRGSIVQIASIYGLLGPDQRIYEGSEYLGRPINTPPVYTASKAGVIGLTKHLATYWGHRGVRVNTLTPGGVASGQNATFQSKYGARIPLGRMARAEEIVGAMLFLASDASGFVSGHNLVVDGGLAAW